MFLIPLITIQPITALRAEFESEIPTSNLYEISHALKFAATDNIMGGTCNVHGKEYNFIYFSLENLKGSYHLKALGLYEKTSLKWIIGVW
jgi:hypothetical protein